jgi:exopolyphosphatase/guanosine-5'-triphosphate,3'-diphosphate pyrophosphatase
MEPIPETLAAIDIGTNSIHLVVVKVKDHQRFEILAQEKEVVRLGSGSKDMKTLKDDAMDRGIETLKRFEQIADISKAEVKAVATSAVREALNREIFIQRAQEEAGIHVEVISGFEEARLIYLGVLQALPILEKKILLVDIGGGSTEFVLAQGGEVQIANSLKLGALRLTNCFFEGDPVEPKAVNRCRQFVRAFLNPMARTVLRHGFELTVGSSGTILNIAQIIQARQGNSYGRLMSNFVFSSEELAEVVKMLVKAGSWKRLLKIEGIDPQRADIILAGAIILEQVFEEMSISSMTVSDFALREGVILDALRKGQGGIIHQLTDIRYKGVLHLAESCQYDKQHSHQVTKLSLQLFDQLRPLHQLDEVYREYLEAASLLHDIGFFISHSQHHRHSYYMIRNSEYLTGFTTHEIELIAQVARYHRKSAPKAKHEEFARLEPKDQLVVRRLSAMLRLASALDRTHACLVKSLKCELSDQELTVYLKTAPGVDPQLEVYTAEMRKTLLEEVCGVRLGFAVTSELPFTDAAGSAQEQQENGQAA